MFDKVQYPMIVPNYNDYASIGVINEHKVAKDAWNNMTRCLGNALKEGVTLFDYGCGPAEYANVMSGILKDFTYYGVEPSGSTMTRGEDVISTADTYLGHDPRVKLGLIGSPLEDEALENSDIAILQSVFTHLPFELFISIMDKFVSILDRGGVVVFSTFLADEYRISGQKMYGLPDCYFKVYYMKEQIEEYCAEHGLVAEYMSSVVAPGGHVHEFFKVSKK